MKRIALLAAIGLSVLGSALPASANQGVAAKGVLSALSTSGVSIKAAHHTLNCALGRRSPSLAGYSVGDRVQVQCRRVARHLVLAKIHHFTVAADGVSAGVPVKFGGTVTALSATSITLHDGDRDLTCTIGDGSPSTDGLKVGSHAKVVCQNGSLVSWAPVTTADAAHLYEGVVTAITDGSISVQSGDHVFTCPLGDGSPSITSVHVGDRVLVGCRVGSNVLVLLKPLAPAPPPTPTITTTGGGTVTAVSPTSLTVHNSEHGDLTCTVGSSSPSVAEVHLGDLVKIGCASGVLAILVRGTTTPPPAPPAPPAPVTLTAGGTLTALTTTSITVHNDEHGDITCSLTDGSPSLADFQLGNHVGIACTGGVLKQIQKLT
jgi:hypothetical protein